MLTKEQVEKIIEIKLSNLGGVGGAMGGTIGSIVTDDIIGAPLSAAAGFLGGSTGTKFGLKLIGLDNQQETVTIQNITQFQPIIKSYFGNDFIYEKNENGTFYFAGIKNSGAANLNPCVMELILKGTELMIFAHAKEGLIKQKTCIKAISDLKKYFETNAILTVNSTPQDKL